jgi:aryl-alcohol dehydrogenase-like predicted oxidoreductase
MEAWEARNADERTWRVVATVDEIAEAHGASSSQVSLAWLAAQPAVTSVILGARTVKQLQDNMGAIELSLSTEELKRLSDASAPRVDDYPYGRAGVAQRHRTIEGGR